MNPCLIPPSRLARLTVLRTQTDERLIFLVRAGSEAAFEAIVRRYRRSLVEHCARLLGGSDAEEAVQDALVSAHSALAGGAEVRSLGPWLHAVSHNAALAILRRRAARPECLHHEPDDGPASDAPHAIRAELRAVVSAVQSLPPRQRDAIVMRELEGRSYSEIATRLGATDGAVRQLLNRARITMRKSLGALIPAGPLARWALVVGDGGSTVAAKLSGAAVLSAVSAIALLPSPHRSAATHVARVPERRLGRAEAAHTPTLTVARAAVFPRRAAARVLSVPAQQPRTSYTVAAVHIRKSRTQPRSTSPSAASSSSSRTVQPSSGGSTGGSPSMTVPTSAASTNGARGAAGSPDQHQPMYQAPMHPAPTGRPTEGQSPGP